MKSHQTGTKTASTILLLFSAMAFGAGTIDFQVIANGTNVGFSFCSKNHVIENETAFVAFCDSINLNYQVLNYRPNFDSVQIIGIVYGQSPGQAWHSINTIYNNGDTTWVEITYSTPTIPPGSFPEAGYKYQMVAIPKQSNPIGFRLVQSTNVNFHNNITNQSPVSKYNVGSSQVYDLLGRRTVTAALRKFSGLRIISNGPKSSRTKSLIVESN
jgi:hypothetical protein